MSPHLAAGAGVADLTAILGAENARAGAPEDAVGGVVPGVCGAPTTREEAARVIDLARGRGWGVVPRGGATQIEMGFPPARFDLALDTRRLDRVVDYQPEDMTVTVEAGVTLAALAALLRTRGQFLPLDPPLAERATVGGTVAAGASGPLRAGYGTPRDWVIGVRVVGADGREVRGGGQVVKNVAGYDLCRLYTGSRGTLGLLVEVTFKVLPRPPARAARAIPVPGAGEAEALLAAVLASDLQPAVLDLEGEAGGGWRVVVEFLHFREAVAWQIARLAEEAAMQALPPPAELAERGTPPLRAFQARLAVVSGQAAAASFAALERCGRHGVAAWVRAHAAGGPVIVEAEEATAALAEELRALAREMGAGCLFARLPPALAGRVDPWGEPGPEIELMRGIRRALDPEGMFSPGRLPGRL